LVDDQPDGALVDISRAVGFLITEARTGRALGGNVHDKIENMGELARIGVAIDSDLLAKFDELIAKRSYQNRSEAFRDMIREELVKDAWTSPDSEVTGTVTMVYDHHVRLLSDKLIEMQHEHHEMVLSSLHVHLDHHNCLEVLIVKGKVEKVRRLADALISTKGVRHGQLAITASKSAL
jgi:CopG family nickel-responsive transcriptional regulator